MLQTLFQSKCFHCKTQVAETSLGLCSLCSLDMTLRARELPSSQYIKSMWALAPYHGPVGSLIRAGKYSSKRRVFRGLGLLMAECALDLPPFDAIVNVPTPWHRKIMRGFDQAEILASAIQEFLTVPHHKILRRHGFDRQAVKTTEERQKQFIGRFSCTDIRLPERILLVDDTITTGATLESCAAVLYQQGATEIIGFALSSTKL
jgi:ComF family protein